MQVASKVIYSGYSFHGICTNVENAKYDIIKLTRAS